MIQSSAFVYSGNSGGAMLDSAGNLLGIVTSNARQETSTGGVDEGRQDEGDGGAQGNGAESAAVLPWLNFTLPVGALEPIARYVSGGPKADPRPGEVGAGVGAALAALEDHDPLLFALWNLDGAALEGARARL